MGALLPVCLGLVALFLALASGVRGGNPIAELLATRTMTPTKTATVTKTTTIAATWTLTASPTFIPTATITPHPGATQVSEVDGMEQVYILAGEFQMGSNDGGDDEKPPHMAYLDAFWIDRTEVTNAMYAQCVQAGACKAPYESKSYTRGSYYGNPQYANYPVIYVDWNQANAYCEWVDRKLPSEAQWEKAARGTDGRKYPWGNQEATCELANFKLGNVNTCVGDTSTVGSYPQGASPYGALDMAENVWEWTADWYGEGYYRQSPRENPTGPSFGGTRVLRGGAWYFSEDDARVAGREVGVSPDGRYDYIGFRCAASSAAMSP